jgi:hypothetical protein
MTKEAYYQMCDELNTEPKDSEIPVEISDFPFAVQEAIQIFNYLPDRWDSMSGVYFGKDYTILPFLIDLHNIDDVQNLFLFLKVAESSLSEIYSNEIKVRKAAQKKAKTNNKGR